MHLRHAVLQRNHQPWLIHRLLLFLLLSTIYRLYSWSDMILIKHPRVSPAPSLGPPVPDPVFPEALEPWFQCLSFRSRQSQYCSLLTRPNYERRMFNSHYRSHTQQRFVSELRMICRLSVTMIASIADHHQSIWSSSVHGGKGLHEHSQTTHYGMNAEWKGIWRGGKMLESWSHKAKYEQPAIRPEIMQEDDTWYIRVVPPDRNP